jgi:hypothetical protein
MSASHVSPINALLIVNYLNQTGSGVLTLLNEYLNTNLDDAVTRRMAIQTPSPPAMVLTL